MKVSRLNKPLALAAVAVALDRSGGRKRARYRQAIVRRPRSENGRLLGAAIDAGPDRLVPFVARYVSVVSRQERLGGLVSSERTLVLPGDVRYELDLAKLDADDALGCLQTRLASTCPKSRLRVRKSISRPHVNMGKWRALLGDERRRSARPQQSCACRRRPQEAGRASVPMRLAREAGRQAVERSFAPPLQAAGFDNAKVVARYPTEGSPVTEPLTAAVPITMC